MSRIESNVPFLQFLASAKPTQRKEVIRTASDQQVNCLCECALNVLRGKPDLTAREREVLRRHKRLIYTLVDKKVGAKKKKQVLQQSGGFLPALITPIVGAILGGLIDRAVGHG